MIPNSAILWYNGEFVSSIQFDFFQDIFLFQNSIIFKVKGYFTLTKISMFCTLSQNYQYLFEK